MPATAPRERTTETRPAGAARTYAVYAAASLVVVVLVGAWLRAGFLSAEVVRGVNAGFLLHAHSHLAFFGWGTMALFAVVAAAAARGAAGEPGWMRWHAHATGLLSAAAFAGFLREGYSGLTIALSSAHVLLWLAFALGAWRTMDALPAAARRVLRTALGFLVAAGLGALTPAFVMAKGVADPWVQKMAIQSFLTPFTLGWLWLGAVGALYARVPGTGRFARRVAWLTALGVLPAAVVNAGLAPPAGWMMVAGRAGLVLVGAGALVFAADLLRAREMPPLVWAASGAALLKGMAEVGVGAGRLLHLVGNRSLSIAFLHLVLLGAVTPALMHAGLGLRPSWARATPYLAGLALMLGSLVVLGWPPLGRVALTLGVDALRLLQLAFAGGAATAAGAVAMVAPAFRVRSGPARRAADRGPAVAVARAA